MSDGVGSARTIGRDDLVLDVRDLATRFYAPFGVVRAVDGVSFQLRRGEVLGLVGESGSGKSVTALSIMGLVPPPGRVDRGDVLLDGKNLLELDDEQMRRVRGDALSMVFQNPLTILNPALRIGWQLREGLLAHRKLGADQVRDRIHKALLEVGISDPAQRASSYPHEYSGGMRQRIVIAMGVMNEPGLLIADEPTTALDVTIQAQVLDLMKRLNTEHGMAMLLITHNMGVVANVCDRVAVMYAGEIIEEAPVEELFDDPKHPYTWALLQSLPKLGAGQDRLPAIAGTPPDMTSPPTGCRFRTRCPFAEDICEDHPDLIEVAPGQLTRCWLAQDGKRFAGRELGEAGHVKGDSREGV